MLTVVVSDSVSLVDSLTSEENVVVIPVVT